MGLADASASFDCVPLNCGSAEMIGMSGVLMAASIRF